MITYTHCTGICAPGRHSCSLVVAMLGAAVAAVAVDVGLAGALLAGRLRGVGRSPAPPLRLPGRRGGALTERLVGYI